MKSANIFLHELILFSLTQLLGIFVAYRYWFYLMPEGLATEVDFKFSYTDIFIILIFLLVFIFIFILNYNTKNIVAQRLRLLSVPVPLSFPFRDFLNL